jgi:hypothetical protein
MANDKLTKEETRALFANYDAAKAEAVAAEAACSAIVKEIVEKTGKRNFKRTVDGESVIFKSHKPRGVGDWSFSLGSPEEEESID